MTKCKSQGTNKKRRRKFGFLTKMKTLSGRKIFNSRRRKGRQKISI